MKPMLLSRIATLAGGRLAGDDVLVDAIATDTRTLAADDGRAVLFLALRGEQFDGHDHVAAAARAGVRAALVARPCAGGLPQVLVDDTGRALGQLAAGLQAARATTVIAITGSNGKTSVKALLMSILRQVPHDDTAAAYANPGNRNNEIGLPLAVIDAPDDASFAVYEMGAGKPGDIAYLTAIARPDVALVNNVAPAHLERMGSLLGIADTKAAILDALPGDGTAVVNADDAFAPYFIERAGDRRVLRFGLEATAEVGASEIRADGAGSRFVLRTPVGEAPVVLALPGRHNVLNALAAASLALAAGVALEHIVAGLDAATGVAGRMACHRLGSGAVLIDDSYNANPGSLDAAVDALASQAGERWLVLGDMRELGADGAALHADAGRRARTAGVTRLYALGVLSAAAAEGFGGDARVFDSHDAVADALRADLRQATTASSTTILVKGSRGSAMDRVVTALLSTEGAAHAA